jgi:AcrR family transcriptional regulator
MNTTSATEETIIRAARKIFTEKGLAGARMQEIADEARVNKALLNYYFRSKEKLFQIVFDEALQHLFSTTAQILRTNLDFEQKLKSIIENEFDVIAANPYLPLFVLNEISKNSTMLQRNIINTPIQSILRTFSKEVEQEVQAGKIRPINGEELFINIVSLVMFPFIGQQLFNTIFEHQDADQYSRNEQRKAHIVAFVLNSLQR